MRATITDGAEGGNCPNVAGMTTEGLSRRARQLSRSAKPSVIIDQTTNVAQQ
jgi:hypothetical protein